jgi:heme exporter protein CcmD
VTWSTFWSMGGFALYVWPSFGFGFLVMAGNLVAASRLEKRVRRELRETHESLSSEEAR